MNLEFLLGSFRDSLFLFLLKLARLAWRQEFGIILKAHPLSLIPMLGRLRCLGVNLLLTLPV